MKQSSIISTWVLSFITMVVFAESPNVIFYLSFIIFTLMSLCIKKHDKEFENEESANDKYYE